METRKSNVGVLVERARADKLQAHDIPEETTNSVTLLGDLIMRCPVFRVSLRASPYHVHTAAFLSARRSRLTDNTSFCSATLHV